MKIRRIRKNDLPVLANLNAEVFRDTTKERALLTFSDAWKKRVAGACLLAEENGEIIGAIIVEKKITFYKNASHIHDFFVKPCWQGKGIGKKLMENAFAALRKGKYRNVSLTVAFENKKAIAIYEKEGFKPFRMLYLKKL